MDTESKSINTTTTEIAAGATEAADGARAFLESMSGIFGAIVVPDQVEIADIAGATYTFKPVLSARQTMRASLVAMEAYDRHADRVRSLITPDALNGDDAAIGSAWAAIAREALDDRSMEKDLESLWEAIHPGMLAKARASCEAPDAGILDLFQVEAIGEGLIPFFARLASSAVAIASRYTTKA